MGYKDGKEADCTIVDASWSKRLEIKTISPVADMVYTSDDIVEDETYKLINEIITKSKSTLIFTNTRSGTERVVFNLKRRFQYGDEVTRIEASRAHVDELAARAAPCTACPPASARSPPAHRARQRRQLQRSLRSTPRGRPSSARSCGR